MPLCLVACLLAACLGVLLRHQFGPLRHELADRIRQALPPSVSVSEVVIEGIADAKLRDFSYEAQFGGGRIHVRAPKVTMRLSPWDALYGGAGAASIHIEDADVVLEEGQRTESPSGLQGLTDLTLPSPLRGLPFTLTIEHARIFNGESQGTHPSWVLTEGYLRNAGGGEWLQMQGEVAWRSGQYAFSHAAIQFDYAGQGVWRAHADISPTDLAMLPSPLSQMHDWIDEGISTATLQVDSYGKGKALLTGEAAFQAVSSPLLPKSLLPLQGTIRCQGELDFAQRNVAIHSAAVDAGDITAWASASLQWPSLAEWPSCTYQVRAAGLQANPLLEHLRNRMPKAFAALEGLAISIDGPAEVHVDGSSSGREEGPHTVSAALLLQGGSLSMQPAALPGFSASIDFGQADLQWDALDKAPQGRLNLAGGSFSYADAGIEGAGLDGTIELNGEGLRCRSLGMELNGGAFSGSFEANVRDRTGTLRLRGVLPSIEDTFLHDRIRHTLLRGDAMLDAELIFAPEHMHIDGTLDATGMAIGFRWWFLKPPGIGLRAEFKGELVPNHRFDLTTQLSGQNTAATIEMEIFPQDGKMGLQEAHAVFDSLDVTTLGQCLRLPYRLVGGVATEGQYSWYRDPGLAPDGTMYWHAEGHCQANELVLQADEARFPMQVHGIELVYQAANTPDRNTGHLRAAAEEARMPSLDQTWFVPTHPPEDLRKRFPPEPRDFTFDLSAAQISLPPWKGRDFQGEALFTDGQAGAPPLMGLQSYQASIEGGRVHGSFVKNRSTNLSESHHAWEDIPVRYILEHMKWPRVVSGMSSGEFEYARDADDPASLAGSGWFSAQDGIFSADFLLRSLTKQLDGDPGALPPSLDFEELRGQVKLAGDTVETPELVLRTPGMAVDASGQFMQHGDLDYHVEVAISPAAAQRIEPLRDYLNLEGHRLAQQDVHLAFNLSGTLDDPVQRLADAPSMRVNLVTGSLEVVSDTLQVIDLPRKVLVDLIKMGGGLIGAGQSTQGNQPDR